MKRSDLQLGMDKAISRRDFLNGVNILVKPVIIIEAMKMEHTLCAPADGTVTGFYFQAGDQVEGGAELLDFVPEDVE